MNRLERDRMDRAAEAAAKRFALALLELEAAHVEYRRAMDERLKWFETQVKAPPAPPSPESTQPRPRRYTMEQTQKIVGITKETLYRRIREGALKIVKDGRRTFVLAEELDRYLTEGAPLVAAPVSPPK